MTHRELVDERTVLTVGAWRIVRGVGYTVDWFGGARGCTATVFAAESPDGRRRRGFRTRREAIVYAEQAQGMRP